MEARMTILAHLLLLEIGICVLGETCPPPEDMSPCSCSKQNEGMVITCSGVDLPALDGVFSQLRGMKIHKLVVEHLKADRLPSRLFSALDVELLDINDCQLQGIADSDEDPAFQGLENSLEALHITRSITGKNKLTHLNLAHLKKLTMLVLSHNNIPEVGNDWFQNGPYGLTVLDIEDCGLRKLGSRAFETLAAIDLLSLNNNPLPTLERSMLPRPAQKLVNIVLKNTSLSSFPDDMFTDMPALTSIFLEHNSIERLPFKTWSPVWEQVFGVLLDENPIICDEHIEWMFSLKRPNYLAAICTSPKERKGMRLDQLIKNNQAR